jgi:hypothetical protein
MLKVNRENEKRAVKEKSENTREVKYLREE